MTPLAKRLTYITTRLLDTTRTSFLVMKIDFSLMIGWPFKISIRLWISQRPRNWPNLFIKDHQWIRSIASRPLRTSLLSISQKWRHQGLAWDHLSRFKISHNNPWRRRCIPQKRIAKMASLTMRGKTLLTWSVKPLRWARWVIQAGERSTSHCFKSKRDKKPTSERLTTSSRPWLRSAMAKV